MNIQLMPQEAPCSAKFNAPMYMTRGFKQEFGELAPLVATCTLLKILVERVNTDQGADYLQLASYNRKTFWIMDSDSYVTFMMPEEY